VWDCTILTRLLRIAFVTNGDCWLTILEIYDLRFTIYDLRFTIYDLRFTIYDLRFTIGDWRLEKDEGQFPISLDIVRVVIFV
jgi:hypothetical protein